MSTKVYGHSIRDAMDLAAAKVGVDGWEGYRWSAATGGSTVEGCVPDGVYLRGPRKGRPRFDKPKAGTMQTVIVSNADLDAAANEYETANGKCWECKGSGQTFSGWSKESGTRYRECSRCKGLGDKP